MTTYSRNFQTATQIEGSGGSSTTLSGTTEEFSSVVDLRDYEGCHVTVEINYDATPTDEVKIKLYGSIDGTNFDDSPVWEIQGDSSVDPQQLSFIIKDFAYFRLGFVQTGSTDSHDVKAYVMEWNWTDT